MQSKEKYRCRMSAEMQIRRAIKEFWPYLTLEEINAYEDRRDEFFLAIRKKHGMRRAEAALILKDIHDQASLKMTNIYASAIKKFA